MENKLNEMWRRCRPQNKRRAQNVRLLHFSVAVFTGMCSEYFVNVRHFLPDLWLLVIRQF